MAVKRKRLAKWFNKCWRLLSAIRDWLVDQWFRDAIVFSLIILVASIGFVILALSNFPEWQAQFWSGVFIEFTGMIFDVAVFGIVIAIFLRLTTRRREIRHQQEVIDDFKKWDSDEARLRIAGAIRRSIRLGKTQIDFGGIALHNFSFLQNDIWTIRGSVFYDGTWGTMGSRDEVVLGDIDFSGVDCRDVIFSRFNPFAGFFRSSMWIIDCNFVEANLSNALFIGANLTWTSKPPTELGKWHKMPEEPPIFEQTHFPPFSNADLNGASFTGAHFENADFRQAKNILTCDFTGADGLESCTFDDEETQKAILSASLADFPGGAPEQS